ncbi:VTT domain-containing protein [Clostridium cellulovorans]|uniref:SNARE associated Golgi protein n=1 Tax=Clostridium cellulovorans (strain ATCC 35296 / DSM 3052 / OCM 3 / 743B) TaxID=573061 RepID=D9SWQ6_CLOC7|nr:VTT domain-containing protein [Clostridium cellulovorans]ADL53338.1 SNARE associated Golgi protein [Clostridium cellulovorans 743B]
MKKINKVIMMSSFWGVVVYVLYRFGLITTDLNKINVIIGNDPIKMRCLFVFLSTVKVAFLIPQTIFIIGGSIIFGPYEGFLLSVLSLAISQSIMYVVGKFFQKQLLGETFLEKNKEIISILKKYGYKVLALGVVCPVTPSDLFTVSAACIKLDYKKCIATIVMADAPMIFLYGFLGIGFKESVGFKILVVILIVFISYYTFYIWNKVKKS